MKKKIKKKNSNGLASSEYYVFQFTTVNLDAVGYIMQFETWFKKLNFLCYRCTCKLLLLVFFSLSKVTPRAGMVGIRVVFILLSSNGVVDVFILVVIRPT